MYVRKGSHLNSLVSQALPKFQGMLQMARVNFRSNFNNVHILFHCQRASCFITTIGVCVVPESV